MVKCVVSACPNRLLGVQRGLVQRPAKRFFSFPEDPARVQEKTSEAEKTRYKRDTSSLHTVVLRRSRRADKQGECCFRCVVLINGDPVPSHSCLAALMERFLELLLAAPGGSLHLGQAVTRLRTCRRRVDDVAGILRSVQLLEEQPGDRVKWIGERPIGSFLWRNRQKLRRNLENLKVMEDTLDSLIKSCSEQLFVMTDDRQNSTYPFTSGRYVMLFFNVSCRTSAYVTHDDLGRLRCFQGQTAIVVKAPEETALSVPAPTEDRIQVHLKGAGPILVLTCDIGSEHFITLEDSWIKTTTLHTDEVCGFSL
ncbi:putative transcription factor E2F6-like [Scophthalmus maximus]|uniref:Putative transcription factor E2F6-like n=1 Tax=Scophthalmus maximus TaxID=52904 RepID=A0A2U9CUW8_SCOMX|nr:putative transcription factor E2F6-like [Scophthalmus maximus]